MLHRWLSRSSSHKGQEESYPVQADLDVVIQLSRKVHWRWETVDGDVTRYNLVINPEVSRWLKDRKIQYRKSKQRIKAEEAKRELWEVFFHFKDPKQARYFKLAWF